MLLTNLKQCLFIITIAISPLNKNLSGSNSNSFCIPEIKLEEVVVKAKPVTRTSKTFLGFELQQPLNTNISSRLKEMLKSYSGPKVRINSLRRFGNKSKHCSGNAVDLEWNTDLINYLVSPEGQQWINQWNLTFYIEAKPGDKCLLPYKKDKLYSEYVFENPSATGPHIHLNLK